MIGIEEAIKNGKNEYVIQLGKDYYIVNEFTYKLISLYLQKKKIGEISAILGEDENKVKNFYQKLKEQLEIGEYYKESYLLDMPIRITWCIENRCNLSCKHCYKGGGFKNDLDLTEKDKIAAKICESKIMEISITGGETLLNENLDKYVKSFLGKHKRVHIFTNGYYLDKFVEKLSTDINHNLLEFEVSIDGTQEIHDAIRGKGVYDRVYSNIEKAIALEIGRAHV